MRIQSRSATRESRAMIDEDFFERKARSFIVADDEIEAWELDAQDLDAMGIDDVHFKASGAE